MTVNFYFRSKVPGNFSIENVFDSVISELEGELLVKRFYSEPKLWLNLALGSARNNSGLHHITGAVNYLAMGLPSERTVITIHDLGHYLVTLRGARKKLYGSLFIDYPCRKVAKITTISDFTKSMLVKSFNVLPSKVVVIPNPVAEFLKKADPPLNDMPVILQIGGGRNKNIEMLMEAVRGLHVKLLLIRPYDQQLEVFLRANGISYEFRSNLTNEGIQKAYSDCDLVYFASTYEGFGLPVIEAQKVGRPVLISRIEPLVEVAANDSAFISDLTSDSIQRTIKKALYEKNLTKEMVDRGFQNAAKFSPTIIAKKYREVYDGLR